MTYSFKKQFGFGQKHERVLDTHFGKAFEIRPANRNEERQGIDRHFKDKKSGRSYKVQYKADKTAARTGNAFIETVSVDSQNIPGWAYSCQADFIMYYIVDSGPVYILRPDAIRRRLSDWLSTYQQRAIPNNGYKTIGVLVPLDVIERMAYRVINI